MSLKRQTALITGASGGIGYELTKLFAADDYDLILVARSQQKLIDFAAELNRTYRVCVTPLVKDLSDPASPDEIAADLQARSLRVDTLVNNAGFGAHGSFDQADLAETLNMLQLNIVTLTHLTHLFLPGMVERKSGHILNVGSTGSFVPVPSMAVYGATKAYVLSFSEALREELTGTGVTVTALCPGMTYTGFQARARVENTRLMKSAGMSAARVAAIGYAAFKRGAPVVIPGVSNRLMIFGSRFGPRSLVLSISRRMLDSV